MTNKPLCCGRFAYWKWVHSWRPSLRGGGGGHHLHWSGCTGDICVCQWNSSAAAAAADFSPPLQPQKEGGNYKSNWGKGGGVCSRERKEVWSLVLPGKLHKEERISKEGKERRGGLIQGEFEWSHWLLGRETTNQLSEYIFSHLFLSPLTSAKAFLKDIVSLFNYKWSK